MVASEGVREDGLAVVRRELEQPVARQQVAQRPDPREVHVVVQAELEVMTVRAEAEVELDGQVDGKEHAKPPVRQHSREQARNDEIGNDFESEADDDRADGSVELRELVEEAEVPDLEN